MKQRTRIPFALVLQGIIAVTVMSSPAMAKVITHERVGEMSLIPLVEERSLIPLGLEYSMRKGLITKAQKDRLEPELDRLYDVIKSERGSFDSALARSLGNDESPQGFDVITISGDTPAPTRAVVFLHGYAGAFVFQCWLFAEAVSDLGITTVCPATTWAGTWSDKRGRGIIDATLSRLEAQGYTDISLAGLSNGAVGAANVSGAFAPRLQRVVLISGSSKRVSRRLPLLTIGSRGDPNVSYRRLEQLGQRRNGQFAEIRGDHFAFLFDRVRAQRAIRAFFSSTRRARVSR